MILKKYLQMNKISTLKTMKIYMLLDKSTQTIIINYIFSFDIKFFIELSC